MNYMGYESTNGIITSPGKFEGQPFYTPYFRDQLADGSGDRIEFNDGETLFYLLINAQDIVDFPDLGEDNRGKFMVMTESEQGFVTASIVNQAQIDAWEDESALPLAWDEEPGEESNTVKIPASGHNGPWEGALSIAMAYMDQDLATTVFDQLPETASDQLALDAYRAAHFAKFNKEFILNPD